MKVQFINNRKVKRAFNNGLWIDKGKMFPCNRTHYRIGLFGFIFTFLIGKPNY